MRDHGAWRTECWGRESKTGRGRPNLTPGPRCFIWLRSEWKVLRRRRDLVYALIPPTPWAAVWKQVGERRLGGQEAVTVVQLGMLGLGRR